MSYTYRVYPEHSFVSVRFGGLVTETLMDEFIEETLLDGAFLACAKELMDWREVHDAELSGAYLRDLARRIDRAGLKFDYLALVMPQSLPYGLARMYQAYRDSGDDTARVFRDISEAYAWLGVPG